MHWPVALFEELVQWPGDRSWTCWHRIWWSCSQVADFTRYPSKACANHKGYNENHTAKSNVAHMGGCGASAQKMVECKAFLLTVAVANEVWFGSPIKHESSIFMVVTSTGCGNITRQTIIFVVYLTKHCQHCCSSFVWKDGASRAS